MIEKYETEDGCTIYTPSDKLWTRSEDTGYNPILVIDELFDFSRSEGDVMAVRQYAVQLGEQAYDFVAGEWTKNVEGFYGIPVMTVDVGVANPEIFRLMGETYKQMGLKRFFIRRPGKKKCLLVDIEPESEISQIGRQEIMALSELKEWEGEEGTLDQKLGEYMGAV